MPNACVRSCHTAVVALLCKETCYASFSALCLSLSPTAVGHLHDLKLVLCFNTPRFVFFFQAYTFLFDVKVGNFYLVPSRVIFLGEVSVDRQNPLCFFRGCFNAGATTIHVSCV